MISLTDGADFEFLVDVPLMLSEIIEISVLLWSVFGPTTNLLLFHMGPSVFNMFEVISSRFSLNSPKCRIGYNIK